MKNMAVIGAGTMGNGIAHVFAQNGWRVTLIDVNSAQLDRAVNTIKKNLERMQSKGTLTPEQVTATLGNISTHTDLKEGVPTLVTLQILRSNNAKDEVLKAKLSKPIPESEITATIKELRAHPALAAAREYLHSLANESKSMLKDLPDGPARKTLEGLCDAIVNRTA